MQRRFLLVLSLGGVTGLLAACGKKENEVAASAAPAKMAPRAPTPEALAEVRGFTVGALMSANPVTVFFDPQCPHCAKLWDAAKPLHGKAKFIWAPVALLNASSLPQGAAILAAADPVAAMNEHEASLLAKKGGISAPGSPPADLAQAIKHNTALMEAFGATGVPFTVARNLRSGQMAKGDGSMSTADLAKLIGVDGP